MNALTRVVIDASDQAGADAELIALCDEFIRLEAASSATSDPDGEQLAERQGPIVDRLCSITPTTPAGVVALARLATRLDQRLARPDDPEDSWDRRVQSLLFRGISGLQAPRWKTGAELGPDAELIEACAKIGELMNQLDDTDDGVPGTPRGDAADEAQRAIFAEMHRVVARLSDLRATTEAGLAARALALGRYDPDHACDHESEGTTPCTMLDALLRDAGALALQRWPNTEAALLALQSEFERLKADYDAFNASSENLDPDVDHGKAFDDFCHRVVEMPPAQTAAGRSFKARAVLAQHEYVDNGGGAHEAIKKLLGELIAGGAA